MRKSKFRKMPGAPITEEQARKYGMELEQLVLEHGGAVSPEQIVEAARAGKMKSIRNEFFDWNDADAAEKWRKQQARMLCNYIAVEVVMPDGGKAVMPYMESIRVEVTAPNGSKSNARRYVTVRVLSKDEIARESVINDAVERILSAAQIIENVMRLGGKRNPVLSAIVRQLRAYAKKMAKAA